MALKDREILENIARGRDNEALSAVYKMSLPKIRKYILSNNGHEDEVKDIFQDTIVIFYRQVKTGKFREELDIDGFLYHVARNLYIKYVTRHTNRNGNTQVKETEDTSENILQQLIGEEKQQVIHRLFENLGTTCSNLLKLVIFQNLSMKEIAAEMGFSNEHVAKTKNYKCRQRLAELVKGNEQLLNYFKH